MQDIWRKLVRAFLHDRCMNDPAKREAHEWLTSVINQAPDRGDITLLREIAQDPNAYLRRHGQAVLSETGPEDIAQLRVLLNALQRRILETLEALEELRASPGYELQQRCLQDERFFDAVVADYCKDLEAEIGSLEEGAGKLAEEIEMLTGGAVI